MIHGASLGLFQPAKFVIGVDPWNPVTGRLAGLGCGSKSAGQGDDGCSCGRGTRGLGGISDDFNAMVSGTASTTTYLIYGGGLVVAYLVLGMLMGGGEPSGRRRRRS